MFYNRTTVYNEPVSAALTNVSIASADLCVTFP
jgi:hypothetical protein